MPGGFTFGQDDINEPSQYAPHSLNVHMNEGVSYDQAKQFLEKLGLAVCPEDHIWEQLSIASVRIPSGTLEEWIARLQSEIAIRRITKVKSYFLSTT